MTQPERIQLLLQKERDGELTQVEAEELTRSLWLLPEARRDRVIWQRLERSAPANPPPRRNTTPLAGRVITGPDARHSPAAWPRPRGCICGVLPIFMRIALTTSSFFAPVQESGSMK